MEKQIKMSLETAKVIYEKTKEDATPANFIFYTWLMENFTKEELEGKKGFTLEESFNREGYWIDSYSRIVSINNSPCCNNNKNIFKTKAQAKSALAFAQLSHIVAKYNEGKGFKMNKVYSVYKNRNGLGADVFYEIFMPHLSFATMQDAITSMEVNRQLWLDYWMIEENK